ncbi:rhomboid-related protein 2 isoform X2 [Mustela putorius furo]|uniref:Rhomboid-related protein 2 n=1 Tax=Mustela putorius furo TaxID=9669 RepID=A0A8U0RA02_MUSPF|nr:rhomboid-related protein 2 isoform X2 [Mustela putorius furo]
MSDPFAVCAEEENRPMVEGGPRTMAADHDLEMEDMNLNMDRDMEGELEEEQEMREDGGREAFKSKKVHRVVSKWMLPEKVRRTYLERANCLPPPVFIISVSLAELVVFIYYAVWKPQKQWITLDTGILESPFTYNPEKREQAWRFVSYMLVHAGVQHIVGNLIMQLALGIPLEMVHKGLRVGLVYLAGVIAGSLASSIFDPLKYLVGASGGVYALMGGYFMNVLVNFREMIPALGIVRLLIIILINATVIPHLDGYHTCDLAGLLLSSLVSYTPSCIAARMIFQKQTSSWVRYGICSLQKVLCPCGRVTGVFCSPCCRWIRWNVHRLHCV